MVVLPVPPIVSVKAVPVTASIAILPARVNVLPLARLFVKVLLTACPTAPLSVMPPVPETVLETAKETAFESVDEVSKD